MKIRLAIGLVCLLAGHGTAHAQPRVLWATGEDGVEDVVRPRLALAADGTFAIATEVFVRDAASGQAAWQIGVRRFSPDADRLGATRFFEPEDGSSVFWDDDFLQNAEIAFLPDGTLLVLMEHVGRIEPDLGGGSEVTVGALSAAGQIIDLHDSGRKVQQALFLPTSTARAFQDQRPRLAVTPQGEVLVVLEASSQSSHLRYVALKAFDAALNEVIEQVVLHDDPTAEQSFHVFPDVATNGALGVTAWQECPVIDNQGNANDCDVVAQFFSTALIGANQTVNAGDTFGTLNLWPAAAMNAGGQSVVAWTDARTGEQGDVFAQRFDASGQRVGGNIQVSTGEGFLQGRPEVAVRADGGFMVVWEDSSAAGFRARGRQFDAAGQPLGPPFALMDDPTYATAFPDVAAGETDYLYTWAAYRDGAFGIFANGPESPVATEAREEPASFILYQNYPNPFNPATTIAYELPMASRVRLTVLDLLGHEITTLVDERQAPGWHVVPFEAGRLASGTYLYRIEAGSFQATRRMLLVR